MREPCWECVAKHVANAGELMQETVLGYPMLIHRVVAQLDQAAAECIKVDLDFADKLREYRLRLFEGWFKVLKENMPWSEFVEHYWVDFDEVIEVVHNKIMKGD